MSITDPKRLAALEAMGLLQAAPDPEYDRLTRVAALGLRVPIALVTFVGKDGQWIPSRVGWEPPFTTLVESFCWCAIERPTLLEVPDATLDPRFSANPLVTGPQAIRFYAGHPVLFEGLVLGTVCVLDRVPRRLSDGDRAMLADLAGMVEALLLSRHQQRQLAQQELRSSRLAQALMESQAGLADAHRIAMVGSWRMRAQELRGAPEMYSVLRRSGVVLPLARQALIDTVHPEDKLRFKDEVLGVAQEGNWFQTEVRHLGPGGETFWLRWVGEKDAQGTEWVGTVQDITDQKEAQRTLQESESRFRLLWETTTDVVLMIDTSSTITFANPSLKATFGYEPGEVIGKSLSMLQPESLRAAHHHGLERYVTSGVRRLDWRSTVTQGRHRDGHLFPIEISFSEMVSGGKRVFAGCLRDISQRREAEDALRASVAAQHELSEQLRESQKMEAIGVLAGGIAHDFNNVLAGILGNTALAMEDLPPEHAAVQSLRETHRAALRGRELIKQILTFARREPHEFEVKAIRPLIEETLALLRATLPAGVALEFTLPTQPLVLMADATQVQQVFMNLCMNAWHALEGETGVVELELSDVHLRVPTRLTTGELPPGHYACVAIRDTGRGMDAATRGRIFDPFFTTKAVGQGTGLGLSVAHGIVQDHGGAIHVESAPAQGSRFTVYLPLHEGPLEPAAPTAAPAMGRVGKGECVLYIDDDDVMVLVVKRMLERLGFRVIAHQNARAALAQLYTAGNTIDVVITDYNMPDISGLDVARAVGAARPGIPVIISSGNIPESLVSDARRAGVKALLQKQNLLEELGTLVRQVLEGGERLSQWGDGLGG